MNLLLLAACSPTVRKATVPSDDSAADTAPWVEHTDSGDAGDADDSGDTGDTGDTGPFDFGTRASTSSTWT